MPLKAVLLDLSGTVHVGETLIPGAREAISQLKLKNIPVNYVTNSSKASQDSLLKGLSTNLSNFTVVGGYWVRYKYVSRKIALCWICYLFKCVFR